MIICVEIRAYHWMVIMGKLKVMELSCLCVQTHG